MLISPRFRVSPEEIYEIKQALFSRRQAELIMILIAIEIFQNIILYLRDDVIHVKIVLATAFMAIARKMIILDYEELEPMYIFATGAVLVATGIAYWLVHKLPLTSQSEDVEA